MSKWKQPGRRVCHRGFWWGCVWGRVVIVASRKGGAE